MRLSAPVWGISLTTDDTSTTVFPLSTPNLKSSKNNIFNFLSLADVFECSDLERWLIGPARIPAAASRQITGAPRSPRAMWQAPDIWRASRAGTGYLYTATRHPPQDRPD